MICRFILLLTIAAPTWACSCGGNWPSVKQAWQKAPFVFLGTVEIADPEGDGRQTMFEEQSVRIHVDEAFKGIVAGRTIELHEGASDCDAKFRTGQRWVFYLDRDATSGSWYVPPCSHSLGSAAPGGDDLLFLRKWPQSAKGTRLSGEVELYEDSPKEAFRLVGGLPAVRVKISGPKGSSIEVLTNAEGAYELYDLPLGQYSVNIAVPAGVRTRFPIVSGSLPVQGTDATVELGANGSASVSFVLQADTRLTGRMLDARGNPIKDVCLDLEPTAGRGEDGGRFFDCSKKGGVFAMAMMPPGQYWLMARDEVKFGNHKSQSTLYYPGTRDRDQAAIITIEAGKYVEHLDMRVPSDEKRYRITGRLQFQDGAPVAYGSVTFTSPERGYSEATHTDAEGSFGFLMLAGMTWELQGEMVFLNTILTSCPPVYDRTAPEGDASLHRRQPNSTHQRL
jgi:hypothetical protein